MLKLDEELTEDVIGIFYDTYNDLKFGFLEKVYQNALYYALLDAGFSVEAQKKMEVHYKGRRIGEYFADIVVEKSLILELKACEKLTKAHEIQLLNYLRCSNIEVGLLLNFGKKPEIKRKVFENRLKTWVGEMGKYGI